MQYFTSDLHLGDQNILTYEKRPFASVEDMKERIIENFAQTLTPKDDLWIVGDFVKGANTDLAAEFFRRVPGRKHLISGNHDRDTIERMPQWTSVSPFKEMKADGQPVTLCHYPLMTWNGAHHDSDAPETLSIQIFGHIHGLTRGWWRCVNVSVELWDYRPATVSQIRARSEENFFAVPLHEDIFPDRKRMAYCNICNTPVDRSRGHGGYVMKEDGIISSFSGQDILQRKANAASHCLDQPVGATICGSCLEAELRYRIIKEDDDYDFFDGVSVADVRPGG